MLSTLKQLSKPLIAKNVACSATALLQQERLIPAIIGKYMSGCKGCSSPCITCTGKRNISTDQKDNSPSSQNNNNDNRLLNSDNSDVTQKRPKVDIASINQNVGAFNTAMQAGAKFSSISSVRKVSSKVEVSFVNGEKSAFPAIWLRDNCQCTACFDPKALGRSFLMSDLSTLTPEISEVTVTPSGDLTITWEDGHKSDFRADWLQQRAFSEDARKKYREKCNLPKVMWSKSFKPAEFDYSGLMEDDQYLLRWLVEQESYGATLVKNTPPSPPAAYDFCERISKVKYTHFGDYSNVLNHPNTNNLAYTNKKLNLHNDMPQYQEIPGLIFLHMIKQSSSGGGDSIISDGLSAAEQMRAQYPEHFQRLVSTDVYYWDKGNAKDSGEMSQFYKICRAPTIQLNNRGEVTAIRFNNQVRDSFVDLSEDEVEKFYASLKIYFDLMYEHSISYRMQSGDMTILDNVRCQHAREAFEGGEAARHLVTTFMTWDEALCRRRRLQDEFFASGK